jgi:uncharacterized membrane protein
MTETPPAPKAHEDRILPAVVYGLYIFGAMSPTPTAPPPVRAWTPTTGS